MDILENKQNKTKNLFQFAVPATIGMLMSSLIIIVDGYFAGNYIGSQALAAINLGLPVLYLYLAVGLMIGVGAVFAVCLFFGGRIYCSFFVQEDAVIKMVSRWFKLFALEFLLQGFNVTGSMYFTAMPKPKQSAVIAMLRGIVILLVTIFVFPSLWGIDEVRELFAAANKADAGLFSFNGKGKCPCCKGRGVIVTELVFMDPVTTVCEECEGKRYSKAALNKKYHGKNIVELLDMSVEDALEFFKGIMTAVRLCSPELQLR